MKYMGSKQKFAKEIYKVICEKTPRSNRAWVEPFAGGFNMICNVPAEDGERYANDSNIYLIEMFNALINGWMPPKEVSKELYYDIKLNKESKYPLHLIGYVGFNCSYSGKWFDGYAGKTPTKIGTIRDYQDEALRNLQKQVEKLKPIYTCCSTYNLIEIPKNSIVYCDPPYQDTKKYKDDFNHNEFWQWVRKLSKEHDVYVSEYKAPEDFDCIWQKETKSSLSANGKQGGSKNSVEKLFVHKG